MKGENSRFFFRSQAPEQTRSAAHALARELPGEGLVLSLSGGLGVGKTQFVKGLAEGLGLDPARVTSPTFAIINEYDAALGPLLVHMDFYRLESEMALEEVGFLDLLASGAILAIEWGDRFSSALPTDRMEIQLSCPAMAITAAAGLSLREIGVTAGGPLSRRTLRAWRNTQPWKCAADSASRDGFGLARARNHGE